MTRKRIRKLSPKGTGWMIVLVLIIILRIMSYFMISEDVVITQAFKMITRVGLSGVLIGLIIAKQNRDNEKVEYHAPFPVILYVLYLIFGTASLLWTTSFHASSLQLAMDFETLLFSFLLIHFYYLIHNRYRERITLAKIIGVAVTTIGLGFYIGLQIDPDHFYRLTHGGEVARLGGFIINPNELGMLLVVGISCLVINVQHEGRYRISKILQIIFLAYLLVLTGSRSSFTAFLLVIGFYAWMQPGKGFRVAMIAGAVALIPLVGLKLFVKQGNVEEVTNMTGRLPFWQDLLTYNFPKAPWFGFGYMRIDYSDKFASLNAYEGAMTHNTFLQVLLGLGLIGLLIVVLQLAAFFHASANCANKQVKGMITLVMIPLLINSFTEFGIFGETNYGILFYLLLIFTVSREPVSLFLRTKARPTHEEHQPGIPDRPYTAA